MTYKKYLNQNPRAIPVISAILSLFILSELLMICAYSSLGCPPGLLIPMFSYIAEMAIPAVLFDCSVHSCEPESWNKKLLVAGPIIITIMGWMAFIAEFRTYMPPM